jgi:hypothetical protein
MTGKEFKQFFKARYGTKLWKHAVLDLKCSTSTCMRLAIMAKIPEKYEKLVGKLK